MLLPRTQTLRSLGENSRRERLPNALLLCSRHLTRAQAFPQPEIHPRRRRGASVYGEKDALLGGKSQAFRGQPSASFATHASLADFANQAEARLRYNPRTSMKPQRPSPQELSRLYEDDYYRGEASGYGPEGYAYHHPNFDDWLELIAYFQPGGTLLDLGCAFGYLVGAARNRGYRAFGADLSTYALRQAGPAGRYCAAADLACLPWPDRSADVVCLFDVVEHLPDPPSALREARRVLADEGLLVLTTPDPLHFDRVEPTHLCERPPSYWLHHLGTLGLATAFRFSVVPYNFQVLAAPADGELARKLHHFGHDFIGPFADIVTEAERLVAVPRAGWGPVRDGRREVRQSPATVYLLPSTAGPHRLDVELTVETEKSPAAVLLLLDGRLLGEILLPPGPAVRTARFTDLPLPGGGHELSVRVTPHPLGILVGGLGFTLSPLPREALLHGLPPRDAWPARGLSTVAWALRPRRVLQVGGLPRRRGAPLVEPADLWSAGRAPQAFAPEVLHVGPGHCDHPRHLPQTSLPLPLADGSFDLVAWTAPPAETTSSDVEQWANELDRLARTWLLVADWTDNSQAASALGPREGTPARPGGANGSAAVTPFLSAWEAYAARQGYRVWRLPLVPLQIPFAPELVNTLETTLPLRLILRFYELSTALLTSRLLSPEQDPAPKREWLLILKDPAAVEEEIVVALDRLAQVPEDTPGAPAPADILLFLAELLQDAAAPTARLRAQLAEIHEHVASLQAELDRLSAHLAATRPQASRLRP